MTWPNTDIIGYPEIRFVTGLDQRQAQRTINHPDVAPHVRRDALGRPTVDLAVLAAHRQPICEAKLDGYGNFPRAHRAGLTNVSAGDIPPRS